MQICCTVRPHRTHRADAAYCYTRCVVCVSVCVLGTPTKADKPIEMLSGEADYTSDPMNHILDKSARWRHLANMIARRRCGCMSANARNAKYTLQQASRQQRLDCVINLPQRRDGCGEEGRMFCMITLRRVQDGGRISNDGRKSFPRHWVLYRLNSTTRARPDPTGPARTLSETRADPTEFLGDPSRKKVRAGPVGSGRARVVEFSYRPIRTMAFFCRVRRSRVIGQFICNRTRQKKAILRRSGDTVGGSDDVSNMTV